MTGFTELLTQFHQQATGLEFLLKTVNIPDPISTRGHDMCRGILASATDRLVRLGETYGAITAQHPVQLLAPDGMTATAKQEALTRNLQTLN